MAWFLDGKSLSTLAWNIQNRSAGWATPARSGENIRVPGRHGSFWVPNKTYDEGHLSLSMWAAGCDADGTLPDDEQGEKKVRDNLDKLTAMFGVGHRLLNLRQTTGTDMAMVNELTNPTMVSRTSTGNALATNYLKDADRSSSTSREFSRNHSSNPWARGNTGVEEVVTEDLFPDPGLWQHKYDQPVRMMTGYYYPINQNSSTYNQFWAPYNAFSWHTGVAGHGVIRHAWGSTWANSAWVGRLTRKVPASRANKTIMFMNFRMASGANGTSLTMRIVPQISYDNSTWVDGTAVDFTATKDYQWVYVPSNKMPAMTGSGEYYVSYRLEIQGGSSMVVGDNFEISRLAIQDAPIAGNPWIGSETFEHIISAGDTPYIWTSGDATNGYGWSVFNRPSALAEWEVVNTGLKATTAPYAFPWHGFDNQSGDGWLSFSVFGGTQNTFRRVLPTATRTQTDARIWGRCWKMAPGTLTARVTERTGSPGSYVYTSVGSVTITGETFTSSTFTLTAGKTYCLEVDVPVSDAGFEPTVFFRELHVSNGRVDTAIPYNTSTKVTGPAARSYYAGQRYASTILGAAYKVPGYSVGQAHIRSKSYTTAGVNWNNEPLGVQSVAGTIQVAKFNFSTQYTPKTFSARVKMDLHGPDHLDQVISMPSSATANLVVTFYNSSNAVTRTVTYSMTGLTVSSMATYTTSMSINAGDVAASVAINLTGAPAFTELWLDYLGLFVNKPADVDYYTGSEIATASTWVKTASWVGAPHFSESILSAPIPATWAFEGFSGFDPDNRAVRFNGTKVIVDAALPAGQAYIGFRRGSFTSNLTVTAKPAGAASATSLGTITSGVDFVQALVTVPAGGSTSVEFTVTGGTPYASVADAFAISGWDKVMPIPSATWAGITRTSYPTPSLITHPSSQGMALSAQMNADRTITVSTGTVLGWNGTLLGGGFLEVPTSGTSYTVYSASRQVSGGYVSAAARLQPATDMPSGAVKMVLQGATDAGITSNTWTTLAEVSWTTTAYAEKKLVDAAIGANQHVRLAFVVTNSTLTRPGTIAAIDGATLTPTPLPFGTNFPGYFKGALSSTGTTEYQGHIRQCLVEVVDAIDMTSMARGTIAEFNVNLTVPGAFWEDVYETTSVAAEATGASSGTFYMSDFGGATAPMDDLIFEVEPVSGTLSEFSLTDRATGTTLKYVGEGSTRFVIDAGTSSVVNVEGRSVIKGVQQSGSGALLPLTPYWRGYGENLTNHVDGTPVLMWAANTPIRVTVTGRRKYLVS